ncbi:MAG: zinc ribbon domain-containing protein [Candidatus Omnitrophota bacterium]
MAEYICPHCKKPVYDEDALLCLYCGESLQRPKYFLKPKIVFIVAVIIVLLSFLALMIRR